MKLRPSPTLALARKVERARAEGGDAWSLSTPSFPVPESLPDVDMRWLKLSAPEGLPDLRARTQEVFFGRWDAPDHSCVITAGAKAGIFAVLQAALKPGARVLLPGPAWPSYEDLCRSAGFVPISLPRVPNTFALDRAELVSQAKSAGAIMLANPCNPTGRILPADELSALATLCKQNDMLLILDQSFSTVIFDQAAWRASVAPVFDRLVLIDSFSKNNLMQGARVAAALVPQTMKDDVIAAHQTIVSAAPTPGQYLALHALEHGHKMPDLSAQRARAEAFIAAQGWSCYPQQGSFYFFPKLPEREAFQERAERQGVFILAGSAFGAAYGDHFRLCFGKPLDELEAIFDRLSAGVA